MMLCQTWALCAKVIVKSLQLSRIPSGVKYNIGDSVATALSRHRNDSSVNVTSHGVAPSSLRVCEFPAAPLPSSELANKASCRQLWGLLLQPRVGS